MNAKEDVINREQLIDVKWNIQYVLQTNKFKYVNIPMVSIQLKIVDLQGDIRTEAFNMSLEEFQVI